MVVSPSNPRMYGCSREAESVRYRTAAERRRSGHSMLLHLEWDVYQFLHVEDGVIVEEASVIDELHMYVELGVIDRDELRDN